MIDAEVYEKALSSSSPAAALRAAVEELSAQGHRKADLYASLEQLVLRLRSEGRAARHEDTILDVMDALTGWCHPNARLLPEDSATDLGR